MPTSRRVFALACVAALGMSPTVGTAQAAGPSAPAAPSGPTAILRDSQTLAGYAGPGGQYGVQSTFIVPYYSRAGEASSAVFPSVVAYRTVDGVEQINGGGGVELHCYPGSCSYVTVLFDSEGTEGGGESEATPGDVIRLTYISDPATRTASSRFENLTMGTVETMSFPFFDTTNVKIGAAARAGFDSVPIFSDIEFKRTIIDGAKITKKTDLAKFDLVDGDGDPLLTTSKIKKHHFVVTPAP